MNRYPLWKNLLILAVVLAGFLFALPSLFDQDPSIQMAPAQGTALSPTAADEVKAALENAGVPLKGVEVEEGKLLVRFLSSEDQLRGRDVVETTLSDRYNGALTLSPDIPQWLRALGAEPMFLGLDLRGGIHVTIDVDMDAAVGNARQQEALEAFDALVNDPSNRVEMDFLPGDIQLINNYHVLHGRTEVVDHDEPERKRLLKRLWLETSYFGPGQRPEWFQNHADHWAARGRTRAG